MEQLVGFAAWLSRKRHASSLFKVAEDDAKWLTQKDCVCGGGKQAGAITLDPMVLRRAAGQQKVSGAYKVEQTSKSSGWEF